VKPIASLLALAFALAAALPTFAQESVSGSGGTLTAPTLVGQNITITGVTLTNGGTTSVSCPITFFGAGTYQWNWSCAGGTLTIDGSVAAKLSGTMTLTCSGGGRLNRTTCWHIFSGNATAANGATGAVSAQAKGGVNNAPGTVTAFSASW
jgi:hypothetical protein